MYYLNENFAAKRKVCGVVDLNFWKNYMCLAIPGKVVDLFEAEGVQMGKMDFDGITKNVCLAYVPDIKVGEYAIVHVGFAIEKLDEKTALETLELFCRMNTLEEELGISDLIQ